MDTRACEEPSAAPAHSGLPRRRMLAGLLAVPLALGLAGILTSGDTDAKKKRKKKGKHKKKPGKGGSGDGGGGTTSPEEAMVDLINDHRAANGQPLLNWQDQIGDAAQAHSDDMAARHYFSHSSPEGKGPQDRIAATGYAADLWGENIFQGGESAQEAFDWWKNSPGHNANMLSPEVQDFGIGRALDTQSGRWLWTAVFASPA